MIKKEKILMRQEKLTEKKANTIAELIIKAIFSLSDDHLILLRDKINEELIKRGLYDV